MRNEADDAGAGGEVALLVEHRVVGQEPLAVDADHPAVGAHRGRVVEVVAGVGEPDDGDARPRAGGHLVDRFAAGPHERRLQQQVLGRVPADGELGEHGEVGTGPFGAVEGVENPERVAVEVAHDRADLAQRDAEPMHRLSLRPASSDSGTEPRDAGRDPAASDRGRRGDRALGRARRRRGSPSTGSTPPPGPGRPSDRRRQTCSRAIVAVDRSQPIAHPTARDRRRRARRPRRPRPSGRPWTADAVDADELVRWRRLEFARIAARDLLGIDGLDATGAALSAIASDVFAGACRLAGPIRRRRRWP